MATLRRDACSGARLSRRWLGGRLAGLLGAPLIAQTPQNPSPMVDTTRRHERIPKSQAKGRRIASAGGSLFIPDGYKGRALLVFFQGGTWLPEIAAGGSRAVLMLPPLKDGSRFPALLAETEEAAATRFDVVSLAGFSAGCQSIRAILRAAAAARVRKVLAIDGIHAGYTGNREVVANDVQPWLDWARMAMRGEKTFLVTHSEVFPGTFASTTETADWLLAQLGLKRRPVLKWGPRGMQQLSAVRSGRFEMLGFAGNSAPDHLDHLHAVGELLRRLDRL